MADKLFKTTTLNLHGNDFSLGYHEGYLHYLICYRGFPFTDKEIYDLLSSTINSVQHSGSYNAGFVLGWAAALRRDHPVPSLVAQGEIVMDNIQRPIGNSFIMTNGDEFVRGYSQGYNVYINNDKGKTFSEGEVHLLLSERLLECYGTMFCTGWIFGWMKALFESDSSSAKMEETTNV